MPDLKISQLPPASTPLAGTELVPIVQGGTTDQTTVQAILTSAVPSGTANGVLYLNGSKVVTSGSGLTFDGTNLGIGVGSRRSITPTSGITSVWDVNQTVAQMYFDADYYMRLNFDSANRAVDYIANSNDSNAKHRWFIGTSGTPNEAMCLNSTGLGIGTNNPAYKLDVVGNALFRGASPSLALEANTGTPATLRLTQNGVGNWLKYFRVSDSSFVEQFGGTDLLALTTSGNLGLGVTPSAWTGSGGKNIEVGATGNALFGSASLTVYSFNANFDSLWKYSRTGFASRYEQQDSNHRWFTAPSGTSGNAISFTQAMTLDASGNLGVGTTNLSAVLNVKPAGVDVKLVVQDGFTTGNLRLSSVDDAYTVYKNLEINSLSTIFYGSGAERLRLKSTGQLRFVPLSSDPAGAEAGDVYYNSSTNKLRVYNGTAWVDLH